MKIGSKIELFVKMENLIKIQIFVKMENLIKNSNFDEKRKIWSKIFEIGFPNLDQKSKFRLEMENLIQKSKFLINHEPDLM